MISKNEQSMINLEARGYVGTEADIETLAQESLVAAEQGSHVKMTYLRVLVASTKAALGMDSKKKRIPTPMDEAETKRQLEALESVHERFYRIVQKVVEKVPIREDERGKERSLVYAARGTFARSSKSILRAWILSGNNISGLVPQKVTKYALTVEVVQRRNPQRAPSERYLHKVASQILGRIRAAKDQSAQVRLIELVMQELVKGIADLGVETTTDLEEALRDHKLLETQTGLVWAGAMAA